jgi:hypothetical protein
MKDFTMPRVDAAGLTSFFRARSIERMRRSADRTASLQRGIERDDALRDRIRHAETTTTFWILHAR